jgi:hypothetical protein
MNTQARIKITSTRIKVTWMGETYRGRFLGYLLSAPVLVVLGMPALIKREFTWESAAEVVAAGCLEITEEDVVI